MGKRQEQLLKDFLKRENLTEKFCWYYINNKDKAKKFTILGAFCWASTEEGHKFWSNKNLEFLKFVGEKLK